MWWNILQLILIFLWTSITGTLSICEKELIICEDKPPKTINCVDSVIRIISASFGRHDTTTCAHPQIRTTNCHAVSSLGIVKGKCNGKSSCSLTASNSVFGDPCAGNFKYLLVSYICEKQEFREAYFKQSGIGDPTVAKSDVAWEINYGSLVKCAIMCFNGFDKCKSFYYIPDRGLCTGLKHHENPDDKPKDARHYRLDKCFN